MSDIIDYELEDEVDGSTPERMKALADPLRSLILDLVLERAMTVTDLAARVGRPKGTVAHHVDLLVSVGLLRVVRTRKVRAMEERFYGRVARTVVMGPGPAGELPFFREATAQADFERMRTSCEQDGGASFTLRRARVSPARADEYIRRLSEIALEFSAEPREGSIEHAMIVGVFPTIRPVAPVEPVEPVEPVAPAKRARTTRHATTVPEPSDARR